MDLSLKFASPKKLKELGIVGMNKRNVVYIAQNNERKLYPTVDDKYKTKLLCEEHGIATPKLIGICSQQHQVRSLPEFLKDDQAFVIKPSKGSGGKGILVITGRDGENYLKPSGKAVTPKELQRHVSNTLSGLYSLGGKPDTALIESLVEFTDDFEGFSYEGVPDIRVILYHGFPVMAMTRLSTQASDGKANLHQGAVGVGIDIATGHALRAVQYAKPITEQPDTGKKLSDLKVRDWHELLCLASQGYEVTGLGYLGADIVLDKTHGPLLLELNARPGLAIQIANGRGLEPRVELAQSMRKENLSYQQRVDFAIENIAVL